MHRLATLTLLLLATPSLAWAQGSTFCGFALLVESHEQAIRCGDPLDSASEQRYRDLRQAIITFIDQNTHQQDGKPAAGASQRYESQVQQRYAGRDTAFCKGADYPHIHQMLLGFTSEGGSRQVLDSLKQPHDPMKGDCL